MTIKEAEQALVDTLPLLAKVDVEHGQLLCRVVTVEIKAGFEIKEIKEAEDLPRFVATRLLAGLIEKMQKKPGRKPQGVTDGEVQDGETP